MITVLHANNLIDAHLLHFYFSSFLVDPVYFFNFTVDLLSDGCFIYISDLAYPVRLLFSSWLRILFDVLEDYIRIWLILSKRFIFFYASGLKFGDCNSVI